MGYPGRLNHDLLPKTPADILIVDDVVENIRLLSNILAQKGYGTRKATSGSMALKAIEAMPPSLILLDIKMPDLSGYEVCQQLKSNLQTAHIPIIFLSAADDASDRVKAFQVGGADYIAKPFQMEEVLARVNHQLAMIAAQHAIAQLNAQLEERVKERTQDLKIANSQLLQMAFCDPLTGLPNRAALMKRLWEALEQQKANPDSQFSLYYLDCDGFKIINDSFGHQVGDELLVAITQRLKSLLRQEDFLARLGGDEFVVLLTQIADSQTAIQIADRIVRNFTFPFRIREYDVCVSLSIGIVSNGSAYSTPETLLRDADLAMYQVKSSGKEGYQIFAPLIHQTTCQIFSLERHLHNRQQSGLMQKHSNL